jgi:hypothetical protein
VLFARCRLASHGSEEVRDPEAEAAVQSIDRSALGVAALGREVLHERQRLAAV